MFLFVCRDHVTWWRMTGSDNDHFLQRREVSSSYLFYPIFVQTVRVGCQFYFCGSIRCFREVEHAARQTDRQTLSLLPWNLPPSFFNLSAVTPHIPSWFTLV